MLLINRILLPRTLHFDRKIDARLADFVIVSISLEPRRKHLDSHLAVGHPVIVSLALRISLQLNPSTLLPAIVIDRMHDHSRIPYGFSVFITQHDEINGRQRLMLFLGCY